MRKSTIFISALLTTFVLAIVAGVVSAYQGVIRATNTNVAQAVSAPTDLAVSSDPLNVDPTATAMILTPQDAAALAAQVMNDTNLYSVESDTLNGSNVYKVTFSSGQLVYVSLDGQIVSVATATPGVSSSLDIVQLPEPTRTNRDHGSGGENNSTSSQSGGEHEGSEGHDD